MTHSLSSILRNFRSIFRECNSDASGHFAHFRKALRYRVYCHRGKIFSVIKAFAADRNKKSTRFGAVQLFAKRKHLSRREVVGKTHCCGVRRDRLAEDFARFPVAGRINKNYGIRAARLFGELGRELMNTNDLRWGRKVPSDFFRRLPRYSIIATKRVPASND